MRAAFKLITALVSAIALTGTAIAEEAAAPFLSVELNLAEQQQGNCRLTFVAQNGMGVDVTAVVFETVLFDRAGQVIDLTLFDFKDLPDGSPRVRQFDLAGVECTSVGRVLLNGVHACTGANLTAESCANALRWSSRTDIEVLG